MITAFASATHGANYITKGVIMAAHVLIYSALFYASFGGWGLIVTPFCVVWWFLLRGRKQAQVELKYMDVGKKDQSSLWDVLKAHYFTGFLTCLALKKWNYGTKAGRRLGWEQLYANTGIAKGKPVRVDHAGRVHPDDLPFWDCRRPTEFATGLTADIVLFIMLGVGLL